ncbi:serine hydrolase-like protein isoform X2 [Choristoneura fumiferana]
MRLKEKEITIEAPWGKIRGLSWGDEGAPPVFLCHGKLDVCSGFRPLVRMLPEGFHYVSVDLPGNGKSDHLPPGVLLTAMDFVPTVRLVREHYRWHKFIYIGHSLGVVLGKFFNIAYPGHISRMVELDPVPAHDSYRPDPAVIREWYHHFYHNYYGHEQYTKLNGGGDNAPKYSFEKALEMVMKNRSLHKEAAECILERAIAPAENGLYRFTHDQRMKRVMRFPLSGNAYGAIYTASKTPTFCVLAQHSIDVGMFDQTPFVKDTNAWPNKNYSFTIVEGRHDVHISHPELMAKDISQFLLKDLKSNL